MLIDPDRSRSLDLSCMSIPLRRASETGWLLTILASGCAGRSVAPPRSTVEEPAPVAEDAPVSSTEDCESQLDVVGPVTTTMGDVQITVGIGDVKGTFGDDDPARCGCEESRRLLGQRDGLGVCFEQAVADLRAKLQYAAKLRGRLSLSQDGVGRVLLGQPMDQLFDAAACAQDVEIGSSSTASWVCPQLERFSACAESGVDVSTLNLSSSCAANFDLVVGETPRGRQGQQ